MRGPVGNFLIAYMKQTKKQTIQLPVFVNNIHKAYLMDKFKLRAMIDAVENTRAEELREVVDSIDRFQHPAAPTPEEKKDSRPSLVAKRHPPPLPPKTAAGDKRDRRIEPLATVTNKRSSAVAKEILSQATYSRHTKSSLAHQKRSVGGPAKEVAVAATITEPATNSRKARGATRQGRKPAVAAVIVTAKPEPQVEEAFSSDMASGNSGYQSVTDNMIQQNNIEKVAMKLGVPDKAISSEERELKRCTFKPSLAKGPTKYQNIKSRLLNHFGENDSINEEDEFAYELKHEMKKRRMLDWQNRSCDGFIGTLMGPTGEQASYTAARPLSPAFSKGFFGIK